MTEKRKGEIAKADRDRIEICNACEFRRREGSGCKFYLKRCSLGKFWKHELPPPDQCPHFDANDDDTDYDADEEQ